MNLNQPLERMLAKFISNIYRNNSIYKQRLWKLLTITKQNYSRESTRGNSKQSLWDQDHKIPTIPPPSRWIWFRFRIMTKKNRCFRLEYKEKDKLLLKNGTIACRFGLSKSCNYRAKELESTLSIFQVKSFKMEWQ
jgi:hypothetical protein